MPFESRIPEWLRSNFAAKLGAVLLAVGTWFIIDSIISNKELLSDVPLVIRTGEGLAVLKRSVDSVDVVFRGSREDIQRLKRGEVSVEISTGEASGRTVIRLKPEHVKAPRGCRVVSMDPETVDVELDREDEKKVPVRPVTEDALPDGYVLDKLIPTPTNVTIRGPVGQLKDVKEIRTRPISLKGRNGTFRERIALAAPSDIWDARMDPERVMVEAAIVEHTSEKLVEAVPVSAMVGTGSRLLIRVEPSHVNITLKGGEDILKEADVTRISAYVDCSGMDAGASSVLPVKVVPLPRMAVDRIEPDVVNVEVGVR